jgi:hypothetical protein
LVLVEKHRVKVSHNMPVAGLLDVWDTCAVEVGNGPEAVVPGTDVVVAKERCWVVLKAAAESPWKSRPAFAILVLRDEKPT